MTKYKKCRCCGYKFLNCSKFFRNRGGGRLTAKCKICLSEIEIERRAVKSLTETPEAREIRLERSRLAGRKHRQKKRPCSNRRTFRVRQSDLIPLTATTQNERIKESKRNSEQRLYRTSALHRIKKRARNMMRACVRGAKTERWEALCGYSFAELKRHIERQFTKGMTWENHGRRGWHIDHILPVSSFDIREPGDEAFRQCWALSNLRPLWGDENIRKQAKRTHLL